MYLCNVIRKTQEVGATLKILLKVMNTTILEMLKANRTMVENRYDEMMKLNSYTGMPIIESKKFYFEVVFNYFDTMSKVKVNRCLKSDNKYYNFIYELNKAIDAADYAVNKPSREYLSAERYNSNYANRIAH